MTNYTKTTDFAAKDSLPSGDSGKIIRGSEFETEFDNIATAVNSKSDANNPTFTGTVTIDGLTVNGNTILGNAATDTVTVTADIASNLIPSADDTYDLGAVGAEWNDLFIDGTANIDSLVADTADINSGTIDGVTIGGSSAGAITGTTITGTSFVTSGDMTFGDNDKAIFGAGSDLLIFHDGSHSYIRDSGTGNLNIQAQNFTVSNGHPDYKYYINAQSDGFLKLYYNGSEKLATTATGIDVTGTVTATDSGTKHVTISNTSLGNLASPKFTDVLFKGYNNSDKARIRGVDETGNAFGGRLLFETSDAFSNDQSTLKTRLGVDRNGDVSFYEDTGTTAKFFWDASAESLTLGTGLGGTANHPLNVGGEIAVVNNSGANPSDAGSFYWKESGGTWGTDMFGARARYDGSANILKFEFANLTSTGTNLELERDTGNVHIPTGKLGIGTSSPSTTLDVSGTATISEGSSGATAPSDSNTLIIENNGNAGAVILTPDGSSGQLRFGDVTDGSSAFVQYNSTDNLMTVGTSRASGELRFTTGNVGERVRIDSSGNVGIGTDSPSEKLHVYDSTVVTSSSNIDVATFQSQTANVGGAGFKSGIRLQHSTDTDKAVRITAIQANDYSNSMHMGFEVSNSSSTPPFEAARITAGGHLLVGKTSQDVTNDVGFEAKNSGEIGATTDGTAAGYFNRKTSDGTIAEFRKDNTTVGSIGTISSGLYIGDSDVGIRFLPSLESIEPFNVGTGGPRDNGIDLGRSASRFKDLYLSGGISFDPNAAANKLDDYEEGTWTPTALNYDGTLTVDSATYIKIGNLVTARAKVSFSNTTDASGVNITSLPFSHSGIDKGNGGFVVSTTVSSAVRMQALGTGSLYLLEADDSNVSYTSMANTSLEFVVSYEAV